MAATVISLGASHIILPEEYLQCSPGTRVRLVARLSEYNAQQDMAIVVDPDETRGSSLRIRVHTKMLHSTRSLGELGSLLNVLGSIEEDQTGTRVIKATTCHEVDGLDADLWRRALLRRREFLRRNDA